MAPEPAEISSILVYVGLDRVGDGLLKLPFVRGLRAAFPDARITWLAGKETSTYASVLAPLVAGLLDEVVEHGGIGHHPGELLRRPLEGTALAGRRFDLVIDTQRIFWVSLSLWRVPHRRFVSPAARFLLSSRRPGAGYRFPRSMQDQLMDLLALAQGTDPAAPDAPKAPARLEIDIPADEAALAAELLPSGAESAGPAYVGLGPGSGGPPKCWPLANFIAVARDLAARGHVPVFILGPREAHWRDDIAAAVPQALFPLQAPGAEARHGWRPTATVALGRRLEAAVVNDSGICHMLATAGTPLVALYGATAPEKFMPMTEAITFVRAQDFGGRAMDAIPVAPVTEAVLERLAV